MRRRLSIFVLVLLLAPLALPLTLAGGVPAGPICCRPGGAHHCTGTAGRAPLGDGFRDAARKCPYAHARLLPNSPRPQAPAIVPAPHSAKAPCIGLNRIQPAAPVADLQSSRAPPVFSSL